MLNILLSIITVVISIISCVFGLALTLSAIDGNQFWPTLVYASALWLYGVVMLFMLILSWYKPSDNQVTHTRNLGILIIGIVLVGCFDSARLSLSLDQILIPCAIKSLAAKKPSSLLCRASQPSQRAPQLAIPVRLLSIKPPSLAIAM